MGLLWTTWHCDGDGLGLHDFAAGVLETEIDGEHYQDRLLSDWSEAYAIWMGEGQLGSQGPRRPKCEVGEKLGCACTWYRREPGSSRELLSNCSVVRDRADLRLSVLARFCAWLRHQVGAHDQRRIVPGIGM
jgi:hypothetical protein